MKKAMTKEQVAAMSPKQVHEVLGQAMLTDGYDLVCDLKKSHDIYLYDSRNEEFYLDFFSFFASLPLGFNHPKMNTAEFREKLGYVGIIKPSLSDIYTLEEAQFVETFRRVAMPEDMNNLFFISGGALAVENALKIAFDWKVRKNKCAGKGDKGTKVLHFVHAFHGRTGYTLSLTNSHDPRKTMYFPKLDWPRISTPAAKFPIADNLDAIVTAEKKAIEEIHAAIKANPDDIAALIIEPIQGEGGDNHFRPEFMQEIRKITQENEIIFVVDEVQSGMGLTGKMWAYEHYGIKPDIASIGKKSQVCGLMASDKIKEVKNSCFEESSRINSTWGGNLVDMVRAQRILEIYEEDNLVENAAKMGDYLQGELNAIADENKNLISNVRGKGLMCAFDLSSSEKRDDLVGKVYDRKMILLGCGEKTIRFRPSVIINKDGIDKGIAIIKEAIAAMV